MYVKIAGAICIIGVCGAVGFHIALQYIQEEDTLRQLLRMIDLMEWEIQYRMTPLPDLCRICGESENGMIPTVFHNLAKELNMQKQTDVSHCMDTVIKKMSTMPPKTTALLHQLGLYLGKFDLHGQVNSLNAVKAACTRAAEEIALNRGERTRRYQTIGLCAGAALVILFA